MVALAGCGGGGGGGGATSGTSGGTGTGGGTGSGTQAPESRHWSTPSIMGALNVAGPDSAAQPLLNGAGTGHPVAIWPLGFGGSSSPWSTRLNPSTQSWLPTIPLSDRENAQQIAYDLAGDQAGNQLAICNGFGLRAFFYHPATGWGAPFHVDSAGTTGLAKAALAPDGHAVVTWLRNSVTPGVAFDVVASVYTPGAGWASPVSIGDDRYPLIGNCMLEVTPTGDFVGTWLASSSSGPVGFVRTYSVITGWGALESIPVSPYVDQGSLQIRTDRNGDQIACWLGGLDSNHLFPMLSQRSKGGVWTTPFTPASAGSPPFESLGQLFPIRELVSLRLNSNGEGVFVWTSTELNGAQLITYNPAGGWSTVQHLVGPGTVGGNAFPSAAINDAGDIVVVWNGFSRPNGNGGYFFDVDSQCLPKGGAWSEAERIDGFSGFGAHAIFPVVSLNNLGETACTWLGRADQDHGSVYALHGTFGFTWSGPSDVSPISFGTSSRPRIDVDQYGEFLLGWDQQGQSASFAFVGSLRAPLPDGSLPYGPSYISLANALGPPGMSKQHTEIACLRSFAAIGDGSGYGIYEASDGGPSQLMYTRGSMSTPPMAWGAATTTALNNSGTGADESHVASFETADEPLFLWRQTGSTQHEIWAYHPGFDTGGQPFVPVRLDNGSGEVHGLKLVSESSGRAFAFWQQAAAGPMEIWYSTTTDLRHWTAAAKVPTPAGSWVEYSAALSHTGNLMLTFRSDGSEGQVGAITWQSTSGWAAPVPLGSGVIASLDVAVDGDKSFLVGWILSGASESQAWSRAVTIGSGWGDPHLLNAAGTAASSIRTGMDSQGGAEVIWLQGTSGMESVWAAHHSVSQGWYAPIRVSASSLPCSEPQIAVAGAGHAVVTWTQGNPGSTLIKYAYYH